jgi:hypothetical protein
MGDAVAQNELRIAWGSEYRYVAVVHVHVKFIHYQ